MSVTFELLLWCGFRPGNFHMPWVHGQKKKKKSGTIFSEGVEAVPRV